MVEIHPVPLPKISANDEVATIVEWFKSAGDFVRKGEVICSAETSKSVIDIEAPEDGYLSPLTEVGTQSPIGEPVAVLTSQPVAAPELQALLAATQSEKAQSKSIQPDRNGYGEITLKAMRLLRQYGIDPADLSSTTGKVTEDDVMHWVEIRKQMKPASQDIHDLMDDLDIAHRTQQILIIGGGDGAVQVLDVLAKTPGQRAVAIVDDNQAVHDKTIGGAPVIGGIDIERIVDLYQGHTFDAAVISISTIIKLREKIFDTLQSRGVRFANVVHPSTVIGSNVHLGEGNVIMAFCHLGACAVLGNNNFLSAYCSIEHHNRMGNHCSFGPGVVTSSRVIFGDRVRCGTGIYIEPKITIGTDAVISSGCIIWKNVPEKTTLKSKLNYVERPQK